jgi:hypothetical protein
VTQAILGAGGAILCVLIGQLLTRWSQRNQWLRDQKIQELRELVKALTAATADSEFYVAVTVGNPNWTGGKSGESIAEAQRVIDDRIFIRSEMKRMKAEERFFAARHKLIEDHDILGFRKRTEELIEEIVKIAERL